MLALRHACIGLIGLLLLFSPMAAWALDYELRVTGLDQLAADDLHALQDGAAQDPGALADSISQLILDAVLLEQLRGEGAPSLFALNRRAENDVDRVQAVMRSQGFYSARVAIEVLSGEPTDGEEAPLPVAEIEVTPGPQYSIAAVLIENPDGTLLNLVEADSLPLKPGQPALSASVLAAEPLGVQQLRAQGHALATSTKRRVTVNRETQALTVRYRYRPGPLVRFGEVTVKGLEEVGEAAVRKRITVETGALFNPTVLGKTRSGVSGLGTFDSVTARLVGMDAVDPEADEVTLPVEVVVEERAFRTIGGAVTLSTDEGFGAEARWSHRNILGEAERLEVIANVGRIGAPDARGIDYGIATDLRKPDFLMVDQDLIVGATAEVEAPDAFERQAIELRASIERPLFEVADFSTGVTLAFEDVKDNDDEDGEQFVTLAFPNTLSFDRTDDLLDPTEGYAVDFTLEPVLTVNDVGSSYFIMGTTGRTFWSPFESNRLILAGRAGLGAIAGADVDDIPANRRFFSGGDGSVRGYAFQAVGPRDDDNDPSGGRSVFEIGTEARIRITDTIGVVPFIDAGIVTEESFVDFSEDMRVGTGLGLRYFTGFGPLRVDVGVPVNPDDDDDAFQVYFSLGQAF